MIAVRATPATCLQTLTLAAKPRLDRLHLRELFRDGRRYDVHPMKNGFQITSSARLLWVAGRARTPVAATVYGSFITPTPEVTLVRLRVGASRVTTLRALFVPLWASVFVVALSWPLAPSVALIVLLLALGWAGARLNAALQGLELVFFVQKVLADLPPGELPALSAAAADVVRTPGERDFAAAWQQFYSEMHDER